ncbi:MAG TPA: hypothetical protein VEP90_27055 [Methylomirabilota bacterium]|nr:hypothetical protein [Methylomirabilota bacterium]
MKYKHAYEDIRDKYTELKANHDVLRKESKSLVNYILRIKKKCELNNLWLMASHDPYKKPNPEEQQGPMITKLFDIVQTIKKRLK